MGSDDQGGARPAGPVVLRIKLRYDDVETMVSRFANNVGKSGLFLPTKSLQPVGAEVKFELRLSDDKPVITGLGRVKASRAPDPANPKAAFGMAIELLRVTRESRRIPPHPHVGGVAGELHRGFEILDQAPGEFRVAGHFLGPDHFAILHRGQLAILWSRKGLGCGEAKLVLGTQRDVERSRGQDRLSAGIALKGG